MLRGREEREKGEKRESARRKDRPIELLHGVEDTGDGNGWKRPRKIRKGSYREQKDGSDTENTSLVLLTT